MDYASMSAEELRKLLAEKDAKIAAVEAAAASKYRIKVAESGGVSVYGFNAQYPITLYRPQWEKLATMMPEIAKFIVANEALLSTGKDDPKFAAYRAKKAAEKAAHK